MFCRKLIPFISSEKSSLFPTLMFLYHLKLKINALRTALIALALFNDWKFGSVLDLVTFMGALEHWTSQMFSDSPTISPSIHDIPDMDMQTGL